MRVQNVLGYFACWCKIFQDILRACVECPRIFCMRVQNILRYFVCGCSVLGYFAYRCRMSQDILHAGEGYFVCGCRMSQDILHSGVEYLGYFACVQNILGCFVVVECPRVFSLWVQNVVGYFVCGCRMSQGILLAGVKCPRIFCMLV